LYQQLVCLSYCFVADILWIDKPDIGRVQTAQPSRASKMHGSKKNYSLILIPHSNKKKLIG